MLSPDPAIVADSAPTGWSGRRWWWSTGLVLVVALCATIPTTGDIGLTWDEPSYRDSQLVSAQWWERLGQVRSRADLAALTTSETLYFYWPYARFGYNFHPPLGGQLNLLTYTLFGGWLKDIPARRLASVFEYAATITLAFGFLARWSGPWVGGIAAGSLLVMPRLYGDGHIAATDTPGLLLWVVAALAFWKGLHDVNGRAWRVVVGVALGLSFLEKMAAVAVLGPLLLWLLLTRVPRIVTRPGGRATLIDAVVTSTALLIPIGLAFAEVRRLAKIYPPPNMTDVFHLQPGSNLPGGVLAVPLLVWLVRRWAARIWRNHPVWGAERPGLEIWASILGFAPVISWLGNPGWWRDTLPRMAHYYALSADRRGALPDIRIIYLGDIYTYSLPWHNAWVLIAITVPAGILVAGGVGLVVSLGRSWRIRDSLPVFFTLQLVFLPALRMLPTPAHDGVRLLLPTFFFLAAFTGWGAVATADLIARWVGRTTLWRGLIAALILLPAGWQLVRIHPFELSYYNEFIGGPRGAWNRGFELSYWYEAFDGATLDKLNQKLPEGATVAFLNGLINTPSLGCLQDLGKLRSDIILGSPDASQIPYGWMLTHDSKANPFDRLLFAMKPLYARTPAQLDGLRVVTLDEPSTVARAWALDLLTHVATPSPVLRAPGWVRSSPWLAPLGRFWGEGVTMGPVLAVDPTIFTWARSDPAGLRAAARVIAAQGTSKPGSGAARLRSFLDRRVFDNPETQEQWRRMWLEPILRNRPEAVAEAVEILITRPDAVRATLLHAGYRDPAATGGYLDAGIGP